METPTINADAARLLVGMPDTDVIWARQVSDLMIVDSKVTANLTTLLQMADPNPEFAVYNEGRNLFGRVVHGDDYLAAEPLEAAYAWALSCSAAINRTLMFSSDVQVQFTCRRLTAGRLFAGIDHSVYDTGLLEPGTMYYVDERNGKPTHPLADIFFRSDDNQIVLIDITGGNSHLVKQKLAAHRRWSTRQQRKHEEIKFLHIVIAPMLQNGTDDGSAGRSDRMMELPNVLAVRGRAARNLLGGLSQLFYWLVATK